METSLSLKLQSCNGKPRKITKPGIFLAESGNEIFFSLRESDNAFISNLHDMQRNIMHLIIVLRGINIWSFAQETLCFRKESLERTGNFSVYLMDSKCYLLFFINKA